MLSNVRIDIKDNGNEAILTSFVLAQHCEEGKGVELKGKKYFVGGEYEVFLEKEEGRGWGIKRWGLVVIWREGDEGVLGRGV